MEGKVHTYKVDLDASNQKTSSIREAGSHREAAEQALLGWHRDAHITYSCQGSDWDGTYTRFTARVGRTWGSIKVRCVGEGRL